MGHRSLLGVVETFQQFGSACYGVHRVQFTICSLALTISASPAVRACGTVNRRAGSRPGRTC
jgi:hypothetical protein